MMNPDVKSRARVAVIGTGGTFAMHGRGPFDWVEYGESGIVRPITELIDMLGSLEVDVEILPVPFRALPSTGITPEDWLGLAQLIARTANEDPSIDGFVVTHGTATLEETAWFLDLALPPTLNVVLTGAQRPANTSGSDVQANLRAALVVAAGSHGIAPGVTVVMNNTVFAARDVIKSSSFDLAAFESPVYGPLALVDANAQVHWRRRPSDYGRIPSLDILAIDTLPRVDVVMSYAGADGTLVEACVAAGARGIVSAGLVPGRPANGEAQALREAVQKGVVVVQASRGAKGFVAPQAFLERDGIVAAGDLAPQKARVLLMLALAAGVAPEELQALYMPDHLD